MRTTHRTSHQRRGRAASLDIMRPSDAFAVRRTALEKNPGRWMRPFFIVTSVLAAIAMVAGFAPR